MSELKKIFLFELVVEGGQTIVLDSFHEFTERGLMQESIAVKLFQREHCPNSQYSPIGSMVEAMSMADSIISGRSVYIGDDVYRLKEVVLHYPLEVVDCSKQNEEVKHLCFCVRREFENHTDILIVADSSDSTFKGRVISWLMDELDLSDEDAEKAWNDMHDNDVFFEFYYMGDSYTIEEV